MQENELDTFDDDSRHHARSDKLFAVLKILVLLAIIVPVVVFMVYRERNLKKGTRSYARQAVGSERAQAVKSVDVMAERKKTNYIDKVVNVTNYMTNYIDKVVDVVVLRTNEVERQVSLLTSSEMDDSKRMIEQTLAELAGELDVGADEPDALVTNVIERKVDVEVVRMVTNYVDRPVEVEIERPVTNVVERKVDVEVARVITNFVGRPVTVNVDRFFTNVVERPVAVTIERPVTNFIDRIVNVPVERVVTNLVRRAVNVYVDVPVTNVVKRPVDVVMTNEVRRLVVVYVDRPVTNYVERKIQVLVDRPVRTSVQTQQTVARTSQTAVQAPQVRRQSRLMTPYRVKSGDTVGGLARRYGFRIPDFRVYNPNVDINRISIGQVLYLPGDVDTSQ